MTDLFAELDALESDAELPRAPTISALLLEAPGKDVDDAILRASREAAEEFRLARELMQQLSRGEDGEFGNILTSLDEPVPRLPAPAGAPVTSLDDARRKRRAWIWVSSGTLLAACVAMFFITAPMMQMKTMETTADFESIPKPAMTPTGRSGAGAPVDKARTEFLEEDPKPSPSSKLGAADGAQGVAAAKKVMPPPPPSRAPPRKAMRARSTRRTQPEPKAAKGTGKNASGAPPVERRISGEARARMLTCLAANDASRSEIAVKIALSSERRPRTVETVDRGLPRSVGRCIELGIQNLRYPGRPGAVVYRTISLGSR